MTFYDPGPGPGFFTAGVVAGRECRILAAGGPRDTRVAAAAADGRLVVLQVTGSGDFARELWFAVPFVSVLSQAGGCSVTSDSSPPGPQRSSQTVKFRDEPGGSWATKACDDEGRLSDKATGQTVITFISSDRLLLLLSFVNFAFSLAIMGGSHCLLA